MSSSNSALAPPPPGQHSDFIAPPNHDAPLIAILVVYIVITTPLVAIRMYTRQFITRQTWWDDWTCLLGWAFLMALIGQQFAALHIGGGREMWNVDKEERIDLVRMFKQMEIVARVGMFFTKASILLLLDRLFVPQGTRWTAIWWGIWLNFWWNLLYAIGLILAVLLDCVDNPLKKAAEQSCENQWATLLGASVINVLTDLAIFIIPIMAVRKLHMSATRKWKWFAAFALGVIAVFASLARLIFQVFKAKNQTNIVLMLVMLLASLEQLVGVLVPCLAAMPAFWRYCRGTERSTAARNSGGRKYNPWTFSTQKGPRSTRKTKDPFPIFSTAGHEEPGDLEGTQHVENDTIMLVPPKSYPADGKGSAEWPMTSVHSVCTENSR